MRRRGRLAELSALAEAAGGWDRLVEMTLASVRDRPIPDALVDALARAPLVERPSAKPVRRIVYPERYAQTLVMVCQGRSDPEIASATSYSLEAVKSRVRRLCSLYGARNRTHLAALAVAHAMGRLRIGE